MDYEQLNLKYWRDMYDLARDTELEPYMLVQYKDAVDEDWQTCECTPVFMPLNTEYRFAVGILNNAPVFDNDIIYSKHDGREWRIQDYLNDENIVECVIYNDMIPVDILPLEDRIMYMPPKELDYMFAWEPRDIDDSPFYLPFEIE